MFIINGVTYSGRLCTAAGTDARGISATFPGGLTDEEINVLKNAKAVTDCGRYAETPLGTYSLTGWRSIVNTDDGIEILWSTVNVDEVKRIDSGIEDLTQAVLELAAIIGGGENG